MLTICTYYVPGALLDAGDPVNRKMWSMPSWTLRKKHRHKQTITKQFEECCDMGNTGFTKLLTLEKSMSKDRNLEVSCEGNSTMPLTKLLSENHFPTYLRDSSLILPF